MKHYLLQLIILTTSLSCNVATKRVETRPSKSEYSWTRENGKINSNLKGYWKSIGNGYILDATKDSIALYSYTTNFCYKEKNDYIEGMLNAQARFSRYNDTIHLFLSDYGDKTYQLQIKNDFVKIPGLPFNCIAFSAMQQLSPRQLFNLFIETLEENYAFSKERKLDWVAIKEEYEKKLTDTTTEKELFQVLGAIVALSKDNHTKIISQDGETLQYRGTPAAAIVTDVFNHQSQVKNLNDYFNLFFKTNYKNITDSLLHGKGQKTANGQLEWGRLDNNIGYISIYAFVGFSASKISRKQEIDSLDYYLGNIITALKSTEAIIIDISFNFGGYDAAFLSIASFFSNIKVPAYTSQVYNNGKFYDEATVYIEPHPGINYTNPVYILMTDISRSAAEDFAMTMKALPNVKLVGTNTLGILSSMLGKSIGTFYSTSSNQRLLSPDGKYYEVSGVEPDIKLTVFSKENIFDGHKDAIRKLMKIIEKDKK